MFRFKNKYILGAILLSLLSFGCAGFDTTPSPKKSFLSHTKLYRGSYDQVWRSVQIALDKYPIKINNIDTGVIETRSIPEHEIFLPPFVESKNAGGLRYFLKVRVIRMVPKNSRSKNQAVKVVVKKDITIKRDFFAAPERVRSDGLEEKSLLYRIGRELTIDGALERASQSSN